MFRRRTGHQKLRDVGAAASPDLRKCPRNSGSARVIGGNRAVPLSPTVRSAGRVSSSLQPGKLNWRWEKSAMQAPRCAPPSTERAGRAERARGGRGAIGHTLKAELDILARFKCARYALAVWRLPFRQLQFWRDKFWTPYYPMGSREPIILDAVLSNGIAQSFPQREFCALVQFFIQFYRVTGRKAERASPQPKRDGDGVVQLRTPDSRSCRR